MLILENKRKIDPLFVGLDPISIPEFSYQSQGSLYFTYYYIFSNYTIIVIIIVIVDVMWKVTWTVINRTAAKHKLHLI